MYIDFLEKINQKIKTLPLNPIKEDMRLLFTDDEILELRRYEIFVNLFKKYGHKYTFEDYSKMRMNQKYFEPMDKDEDILNLILKCLNSVFFPVVKNIKDLPSSETLIGLIKNVA